MATYSTRYEPRSYLCIMHNLPQENMEPLRSGNRMRTNSRLKKQSTRSVRDDYPALFCEAVHEHLMTSYMSVHKHDEVTDHPWPSNVQVSLMSSILDGLNIPEMEAIRDMLETAPLEGCGHQVLNVESLVKTPQIAVHEKSIKWLMTWVNSYAKGSVLNLDTE